jgi:hypothetical protein
VASPKYSPDPETADVPLDLEEAQALFTNTPRNLTQPRNLKHVLSRVVATVAKAEDSIASMHRYVARMQADAKSVGVAPTLDPSTMLRYVSLEELSAAVDSHSRQRIELLLRQERAVSEALRSLRSRQAGTKSALLSALNDPGLTDSARAHLQVELERVDVAVPEVADVQRGLESLRESVEGEPATEHQDPDLEGLFG